jgi:4-hydroxy-tetrahydrodipicolinate synthase
MLFRGAAPALVTPFTDTDRIDHDAFCRLIDAQIEGGVAALVVLGTTGENPTVSHEERRALVDTAVSHTDGRVPVIVGTGTNDTRESIQFSEEAVEAGADGLLVVGPYYNKPSQRSFSAHVQAIAEATQAPIILYNVPGRTSFNINAETTIALARTVEEVVGVKEASGDLAQISDILSDRPEGFAVYAGDDEMAFPLCALGGDGCVSVISNVEPAAFASLIDTALEGDLEAARARHFDLLPAMRACFFETNPVPVKAVLAADGVMMPHVRLPLLAMEEGSDVYEEIMEAFGRTVAPKV